MQNSFVAVKKRNDELCEVVNSSAVFGPNRAPIEIMLSRAAAEFTDPKEIEKHIGAFSIKRMFIGAKMAAEEMAAE